jgi:hypothetical protein
MIMSLFHLGVLNVIYIYIDIKTRMSNEFLGIQMKL